MTRPQRESQSARRARRVKATSDQPARNQLTAPGAEGSLAAGLAAPWWLRWSLPVAVALITFIAFLPALGNGFVNWDDDKLLLENYHFRGFGAQQLKWMFTTTYMGHYHPLTWLSLAADYRLWKLNPAGYHLGNIILHTLNAALFYLLALRLLSVSSSGRREPSGAALHLAAALAALLFSVHPLRVESVAWATERRDVLSTFFFIACLINYLRYAAGGTRKWVWYSVSVALLLLSLLSKAWGITVPVVLIVLDLFPLRRLRWPWGDLTHGRAGTAWLDKIPFALLAGAGAYAAAKAQAGAEIMKPLQEYDLASRVAQSFYGLAFYVWKTFVPAALAPIYEIPLQMDPLAARFVLSAVAVLAIATLLVAVRKRWPAGLALGASYVILVSPVLGLAQSGPQLAADRYSYVPCMTWAVLGGAALLWGLRAWLARRLSRVALVPIGLGTTSVVVVLAALTWQQTKVWRSSQSLWEHTLKVHPDSWTGHNNLGLTLAKHGKTDEAVSHYAEALRLKPGYLKAHNNLALALAEQGQIDQAIRHFREVLRLHPGHYKAHNNLGLMLEQQARTDQAIEHYNEAVQLNPDFWEAHSNLGVALAKKGRYEQGIAHCREAARLRPDSSKVHSNLGIALVQQGRFDEGMAHYAKALQLEPESLHAHYNLAMALANQGNAEQAIVHFREAARLRPEDYLIRKNLAIALAKRGRFAEAITEFRQAVRLEPGDVDAHYKLGQLLAAQNRMQEAAEQYRQILRIDPHHEAARRALEAASARQEER